MMRKPELGEIEVIGFAAGWIGTIDLWVMSVVSGKRKREHQGTR